MLNLKSLTFTCSISVTEAGLEDVSTLLIAAIACNLAWGTIDAFLYLLACFVEQGHSISTLRAARRAPEPSTAHRMIAEALPPVLASVMSYSAFEKIRTKLNWQQRNSLVARCYERIRTNLQPPKGQGKVYRR